MQELVWTTLDTTRVDTMSARSYCLLWLSDYHMGCLCAIHRSDKGPNPGCRNSIAVLIPSDLWIRQY
jgi:hypothetical protein